MDKVPKKKINFSRVLFFCISSTLEMGTIVSSNTLVMNYHSTLHNISEEWRSHMTIWRYRPWFGLTWSSSVQSGVVQCGLALIFKF